MSAKPGLLLVDEGWHATLALARALDAAGFAVTVLTANDGEAELRRGGVRWTFGPSVASERFVAHVDAIVRAEDIGHVLPLTETAMQRLWDAPVAWRDRIFPRAAVWQQRLVTDKLALLDHAAARGIAIPRHRRVDATFDLDAAARELGWPLVVKGATGVGGARVRIVDTRDALAATLARARSLGGEWFVEEHVASATYLFGGVFAAGEPLRVYAGEKLAQHPARTGGAIRLRSTREPALLELGARVVRELRWTGFASVDVVRRRDGALALLEVNPRLWGSHAGAAAAGVDLFAPFVELLAGGHPRPDLAFADGVEAWIFPKYVSARGGLWRALRDLLGEQGRDWRDPRFALYLWRRDRRMRALTDRL